MVSSRLLSLAAGVIPELMQDPARFVEVTAGACLLYTSPSPRD